MGIITSTQLQSLKPAVTFYTGAFEILPIVYLYVCASQSCNFNKADIGWLVQQWLNCLQKDCQSLLPKIIQACDRQFASIFLLITLGRCLYFVAIHSQLQKRIKQFGKIIILQFLDMFIVFLTPDFSICSWRRLYSLLSCLLRFTCHLVYLIEKHATSYRSIVFVDCLKYARNKNHLLSFQDYCLRSKLTLDSFVLYLSTIAFLFASFIYFEQIISLNNPNRAISTTIDIVLRFCFDVSAQEIDTFVALVLHH